MIRELLGVGAALALFGSAQAQPAAPAPSETVHIAGQNGAAIRAQLLQAAQKVCEATETPQSAVDGYGSSVSSCVTDTYVQALFAAKRADPAAFHRVSMQSLASR